MNTTDGGRHRGGRAGTPRRRVAARTGRIVAAAVSFVLLVGSGLGWYNYRSFNSGVQSISVAGLGGDTGPAAQRPGTAQNILVVGDDSRAGLSQADGRRLHTGDANATTSTDTILLVHIPADGSRATLISIPRDSYVDIPGHPKAKINAAYADGYYYTPSAKTDQKRQQAGADSLVATVKKLTGVGIDHYVQIGFAGFEKVVAAIGTITVNLCHAVDDTRAYNRAHNQSGGSGFKSRAGVQHLDAVRALEFVRQRHNLPGVGDDLGREKRQRYFLSAAFDAILSAHILLNPVRLHDIVTAIAGSFIKDDHLEIQAFAEQMTRLSAGHIAGQTIPASNGPDVPGIGTVLSVDPARVQRFVQNAFYPSTQPASSSSTPRAPSTHRTSAPASTSTPPKALTNCVD